MEREQLYYVLLEQQKNAAEERDFIPRELTARIIFFLKLKHPVVITGVRRTGKSTLLKIIQEELHLKEKEYIYIDFNDERLISFSTEDFQKIDDFLQEYAYAPGCYFLIDEIQEVEQWEKWINRLKEKHPIIITGSNSKLLSKEIASVLTGRSINMGLYPFSFREVLWQKHIESTDAFRDLKIRALVRRELRHFLESGGIPKFVVEQEKKILTELYENIVYRDIIKRFNPRLEKPIKEISLFLLSNVSKELSYRSVSAMVGIKNISTVKSVVDTFEQAFLFYFIPQFDFSVRKQIQNPRKIYCVDNGFITSVGFRFSEDKGKLLENSVFIELKRREKEVYYFSERAECDFIIRDGIKITEAIQVCHTLNQENKNRELTGLMGALKKFNLPEGLLLTFEQEDEIRIATKKIKIVPLWKWLLKK